MAPESPIFSYFPHIPPPTAIRLTVLPEHPCAYLPERASRARAFWASSLDADLYRRFIDAGFRRSGRLVYQPVCRGCRSCQSLRVPVETFAPNKSQRRCWKRNHDLVIAVHAPRPSRQKFELYRSYCQRWHRQTDEITYDNYLEFLYDSPVDSLEFEHFLPDGTLVAVGLCDLSSTSLSSVYFYFDVDHADRGLGTYGAMVELDYCRRQRLDHYYLGYWIDSCGAMSYKAQFRPYELLDLDGQWRRVGDATHEPLAPTLTR